MAEKFEEKYTDVLQNIEVIIISMHRLEPGLLDYDVEAVLEALISRYGAEARGRVAREHALVGLRGKLYDALLPILEWRIGRVDLNGEMADQVQLKTAEELAACLKRVRSSVQRWTKERGRQGYLTFVGRYIM